MSTSIDCVTAWRIFSVIAASVSWSWIAPSPESEMSSECPAAPVSAPPTFWLREGRRPSARARSAASAIRTTTPRGCMAMPPLIEILPSRIFPRTSSRKCSTCVLVTEALSTSIKMWAPPCRSSPSTMARNGTKLGRWLSAVSTTWGERKLGTSSKAAQKTSARMETTFQGARRSIEVFAALAPNGARQEFGRRLKRPARPWPHRPSRARRRCRSGRCETRTFGAISTSTSLSSVDLVTLPIRPPLVTITSPRLRPLHHRLLVLRAFLLRPEDQEIHNGENGDERRELDQHVGRPGGGRAAGLSVGGRGEHRQTPAARRRKTPSEGSKRRGIYNRRAGESNVGRPRP